MSFILAINSERRRTTMGDQVQTPGSSNNCHILVKPSHDTKKIQRECAETCIDMISQLPDSLIVQILSLMPTTDACKTTILSKRWLNLWTFIHNLIFDSWYDNLKLDKFISFTDNVLSLLSCSKIKKFDLCYCGDDEPYNSKIDEWLEIAVKKKVEDLDLDVTFSHEEPYCLPQVLCSSSSILHLNIQNCKISEDCVLNWTSLKSLSLGHLFLRDEHIEQIASNCPQLESLELYRFCVHRLHITSPKLRRLKLNEHVHLDEEFCQSRDVCLCIIVAPYVQYLKISGECVRTKFRIEDMSSLIRAHLTFIGYISQDIDSKTTIVNDLLVGVRFANELKVSSWLIEVISLIMLVKEDISLPLLECKQLIIKPWVAKYSFLGIDFLLRSTPHLENLTILPAKLCNVPSYWDTRNDLKRDNFLSLQGNIFKGSLQNLKSIKASTSKLFSCLFKIDEAPLLELLKSLLEHAPNLEKLVIAP